MAEQPPQEQGLPEPLAVSTFQYAVPAKTIPGAAAGDSDQAAQQPATSQPATSQGQDATPSTREDPIWISKREVRKAAPRTSGSKKTTYFIEFYLVDNHGYETLAATGEDQGLHLPRSLEPCASCMQCANIQGATHCCHCIQRLNNKYVPGHPGPSPNDFASLHGTPGSSLNIQYKL